MPNIEKTENKISAETPLETRNPEFVEKVCSKPGPKVLTSPADFEHSIVARPRILEMVTVDGLERMSGCTPEEWIQFAATQFTENSLDKPDVKKIEVRHWHDDIAQYLLVRDDGHPEFTRESVRLILDYCRAPSSKRAVHCSQPLRGILGNGLQTGVNMSYPLWEEKNRPEHIAEIWNSHERFKITIKVENETATAYFIEEKDEQADRYTTAVLLKFPVNINFHDPKENVENIAKLNPTVSFTYYDNEKLIFHFSAQDGLASVREKDYGCVWWYNWREFYALTQEKKDEPVGKFVTHFIGISNRSKAKQIIDIAGIEPGTKLRDIETEKLKQLFDAMKLNSRRAKATVLPAVGQLGLLHRLSRKTPFVSEAKYVEMRGHYTTSEEKIIPFVIEVATYTDRSEQILEAINFTCNFQKPFSRYDYGEKKISLRDIIKGKGKSIIIHLVCPNLTWLTPSKGQLDPYPFQEPLLKAVRQVMKKKVSAAVSEANLIAWSKEVMDAYPGLTFTVRQVFYRLVSLRGYTNSRQCYNNVGKALAIGRDSGDIDPERIVDLTRPEYINNPSFSTSEDYVAARLKALVEEFDLDRWDTQPVFVEVWIEKEALSRVLLPICRAYRINLIVGKGYNSYTQVYKAVNHRFPKDGRRMIILYLGDHDPPGLHIEEKLKEKVARQAAKKGIRLNLEVRRVALTFDQVKAYDLPPSQLKKNPGARGKEYSELYGPNVWELDALDPELLISLLENEIKGLIEPKAWATKEKEVAHCGKALQQLHFSIGDTNE